MNSEFRDFLAAEYNKLTAKEQKAADTLADEEKSARQKGAQKATVTKAQKRFMDMLKAKVVNDEPKEEPTDGEVADNADIETPQDVQTDDQESSGSTETEEETSTEVPDNDNTEEPKE